MNDVVLAFSGGLDTTYCLLYLRDECGYRVHTVTVDTGGFTSEGKQPSNVVHTSLALQHTPHSTARACSMTNASDTWCSAMYFDMAPIPFQSVQSVPFRLV